VLTDEEIGQEIGSRLRAELDGIDMPPNLSQSLRRRHARRLAATRLSLAAGGTAVIAATAIAVAAATGGPTASGTSRAGAHQPVAILPPGEQVVRLDGYQVKLPAGVPVKKVGSGYLVGDRSTGYFTIFLERGKNIGPALARAHGLTVHRVQVGIRSAWWVGSGHGGELWVQIPGLSTTEFLVAKVLGAGEAAALRFAEGLAVTHMPVVHVSCSTSCG
jgi:hypothetical protein